MKSSRSLGILNHALQISPKVPRINSKLRRSATNPSLALDFSGVHIVIFVHGLMGSSYDFKIHRNMIHSVLRKVDPDRKEVTQLFISSINEKDSMNDIEIMGEKLGQEISDYIDSLKIQINQMSFVCHSLGGLIAR